MFRRKPAPVLIRGGRRFADNNMRQQEDRERIPIPQEWNTFQRILVRPISGWRWRWIRVRYFFFFGVAFGGGLAGAVTTGASGASGSSSRAGESTTFSWPIAWRNSARRC